MDVDQWGTGMVANRAGNVWWNQITAGTVSQRNPNSLSAVENWYTVIVLLGLAGNTTEMVIYDEIQKI